jgi:3-dehydroquinate dehydratase/shikimate dehydrogenase
MWSPSHSPANPTRVWIQAAEAGADLVEIRLDYLAHFNPSTDITKLLAASPLPVIVTFRPTWEG